MVRLRQIPLKRTRTNLNVIGEEKNTKIKLIPKSSSKPKFKGGAFMSKFGSPGRMLPDIPGTNDSYGNQIQIHKKLQGGRALVDLYSILLVTEHSKLV